METISCEEGALMQRLAVGCCFTGREAMHLCYHAVAVVSPPHVPVRLSEMSQKRKLLAARAEEL